METVERSTQCQHSGCKCSHADPDEYCSEYCENASEETVDHNCQCGHPQCSE